MQLENSNYYDWIRKEEVVYGKAKIELKEILNLILSVDTEKCY